MTLSECARHLSRLRPGHRAGHHISNLIGQLENFDRNPAVLRPMILAACQRIEEAQ